MKLSISAPMLLGTKALLDALRIPYIEKTAPDRTPDDLVLDIVDEGPLIQLLPRDGRRAFDQLYNAYKADISLRYWLQAYRTVQDYMTQLDRWKDHKDRLDPLTQHSSIIHYLDQHLEGTFLEARTHYQRSEAIGLNLAKTEILAHKSASPRKCIALGGDIRYLPTLQNYLQSPEQSLLAYSYYACFHYQDIFALTPIRRTCLEQLNPFKPHYCYINYCGIDCNSRQYDGILVVVESDFPKKAKLRQLLAKLKRPAAVYQFSKGQFQLSDCVQVLQKLLSGL